MEISKSVLAKIEGRTLAENNLIESQFAENGELLFSLKDAWKKIYKIDYGKNCDLEFSNDEWEKISITFYSFGMSISARKRPVRFSLNWFFGMPGDSCHVYVKSDACFEQKRGSLKDCVDILPVVLQFLSE